MRSSVPCVCRSSLFVNAELRVPSAASQWLSDSQCQAKKRGPRKTTASELQLIRVPLFEKIHPLPSLAHKRGWDTINYTVYCRLPWPKKCIISVKCVTSTTLGDPSECWGNSELPQELWPILGENTARCVSRNGPKSDRCHLDDESPNLSGIELRCVLCNRPQGNPLPSPVVASSALFFLPWEFLSCDVLYVFLKVWPSPSSLQKV